MRERVCGHGSGTGFFGALRVRSDTDNGVQSPLFFFFQTQPNTKGRAATPGTLR
eukprot:NODE_9543_length_315_cov_14.733083_g7775_i0.p2 GENE.NODE_9543_length_315_cov_14.733083_g7775_i0~~NODE_9543_length_315_cov_14.733083_g7775_i0.p2  ORF type:complete len:54 (-),score=4.11 NODE_9543_length_315_cov_14.733083_g7775_i0:3-164(-)